MKLVKGGVRSRLKCMTKQYSGMLLSQNRSSRKTNSVNSHFTDNGKIMFYVEQADHVSQGISVYTLKKY